MREKFTKLIDLFMRIKVLEVTKDLELIGYYLHEIGQDVTNILTSFN